MFSFFLKIYLTFFKVVVLYSLSLPLSLSPLPLPILHYLASPFPPSPPISSSVPFSPSPVYCFQEKKV
jgi:hypothetical protein